MPKHSPLITPSQGCPAGYGFLPESDKEKDTPDQTQAGVNLLVDGRGISYGDYLMLDQILSAQQPHSKLYGGEIAQILEYPPGCVGGASQ